MLSRCWCISRGSTWSRSISSLNNLHSRNHHVMSSASACSIQTDKSPNRFENAAVNQLILQRLSTPFIGSHRNFSLTSGVSASAGTGAAAAATSVTAATESATPLLDIPELPATPIGETVVQALAANGEPTFASLGLGGYSPIGLLQYALEFMHVSLDLPWYATIALSTVVIRFLLTPLVIITQRNAAVMRNVMPEMQEIQNKLTEARQMGNAVEYAQYNQQLMLFMKEKGFNPIRSMLVPFAQAPIFISYFIGIRRMVNAPVDSLHTGGALWFTDLTLSDPFYILPVVTCTTLALTIKLGTDGTQMSENPMVGYIMKAMPIAIFPFIMNFPAAMVVYWASSNFCSLLQGALFRIPRVRTFFHIPQLIEHKKPGPAKKKEGFVKNVKGAWSNLKMSREIEDRRRLDQINFERAGTGPLVRTYKFDPTKSKKASN